MQTDLSIGAMILGASGVVQLIMLILLLASVFSWAVMEKKRRQYQALDQENQFFEKRFWSGVELEQLFHTLEKHSPPPGSLEAIFQHGYRQFRYLYDQQTLTIDAGLDATERGLRAAYNRQMDTLESLLSLLATIGSTSPYVGLLGTVWGIMTAFQGLASTQQATLAMVAPGIAEALIATAMGLFAAIPAVIAYNSFTQRVEQFGSNYDAFIEDFMGLLQRQALVVRGEND
ncbi:MAG: protein TolQ [Immundisolibacteraceae bacterium]|nr:protein TolQ [Immundisolibacteraceae bacterium]